MASAGQFRRSPHAEIDGAAQVGSLGGALLCVGERYSMKTTPFCSGGDRAQGALLAHGVLHIRHMAQLTVTSSHDRDRKVAAKAGSTLIRVRRRRLELERQLQRYVATQRTWTVGTCLANALLIALTALSAGRSVGVTVFGAATQWQPRR